VATVIWGNPARMMHGVTIIVPPRRWPSVNWRELWRYRDLFITLAWRDISVRYKQTVFGMAWAVFQPLGAMVIFTFVFHRLAGIESGDGTPYPVFVYIGMLLWQYYAGVLTKASNALVANAYLLQKVRFPRLLLPATAVATGLVELAVAAAVLAGLMLWYGCAVHLGGVLLLPLLLAIAMLAALGGGLFLSALHVKYRDVGHVLPFLIQLLMYVTPVIYPVSLLDGYPLLHGLMRWLNPLAAVITNARASLLGLAPIDGAALGIAAISALAMFVGGLYYFRSTEHHFTDVV
jgi:lipopolysaccharide transport system permease protein